MTHVELTNIDDFMRSEFYGKYLNRFRSFFEYIAINLHPHMRTHLMFDAMYHNPTGLHYDNPPEEIQMAVLIGRRNIGGHSTTSHTTVGTVQAFHQDRLSGTQLGAMNAGNRSDFLQTCPVTHQALFVAMPQYTIHSGPPDSMSMKETKRILYDWRASLSMGTRDLSSIASHVRTYHRDTAFAAYPQESDVAYLKRLMTSFAMAFLVSASHV
jgi:hypothetical protein